MSKHLNLSLVIPAYNEESHLGDCLRSALAQSRQFDEIIVVDNSSTDATAVIAAHFPGVRLIHEANQGIVYARTTGFDAALGDIIARIDADTILPTDWAAHVIQFYDDDVHADMAWTSSGLFRDTSMPRLVSAGYRLMSVHVNRWLTGYPTLWGSSMALPATLWRKVSNSTCKGYGFHEDLDLATHLNQLGYGIFWDKDIRVSALLRHAWVSPSELWEYLQWWPRTLRRHRQKTWIICWLGGVCAMFGATLALALYQHWQQRQTSTKEVAASVELQA